MRFLSIKHKFRRCEDSIKAFKLVKEINKHNKYRPSREKIYFISSVGFDEDMETEPIFKDIKYKKFFLCIDSVIYPDKFALEFLNDKTIDYCKKNKKNIKCSFCNKEINNHKKVVIIEGKYFKNICSECAISYCIQNELMDESEIRYFLKEIVAIWEK